MSQKEIWPTEYANWLIQSGKAQFYVYISELG